MSRETARELAKTEPKTLLFRKWPELSRSEDFIGTNGTGLGEAPMDNQDCGRSVIVKLGTSSPTGESKTIDEGFTGEV